MAYKYNLGNSKRRKTGAWYASHLWLKAYQQIGSGANRIDRPYRTTFQYDSGTTYKVSIRAANNGHNQGVINDAPVTFDGRQWNGGTMRTASNYYFMQNFINTWPTHDINHGHGTLLANCILKNWSASGGDMTRSYTIKAGVGINTVQWNYFRHIMYGSAQNWANPITFVNCKIMNSNGGLDLNPEDGNLFTTNGNYYFDQLSFTNCLLINCKFFGDIGKLQDSTLINSYVGKYWVGNEQNLTTCQPYNYYYGAAATVEQAEIKNNFIDGDSVIGFVCAPTYHWLMENFHHNLIKGRISVRKAGGTTSIAQGGNFSGQSSTSGVLSKLYDFRKNNASRQTDYNNFMSADTTHFDAVARHRWGHGDLPLETGDAGNSSLFNMSDAFLGVSGRSSICMDYTPKPESPLVGAGDEGDTIGYSNPAIAVSPSLTTHISGTSINVTNDGNSWSLTGGTTGYVETKIIDFSGKSQVRLTKHEKYWQNDHCEIVNPVEGLPYIVRSALKGGNHNYNTGTASYSIYSGFDLQVNAMPFHRATTHTPKNLIVNGDFSDRLAGWTAVNGATQEGSTLATWGLKASASGDWTWQQGTARCLGTNSRGMGSDSDNNNNDNQNGAGTGWGQGASLTQDGILDKTKIHMCIYRASNEYTGYIKISGSTTVGDGANYINTTYATSIFQGFDTYCCWISGVTGVKIYANTTNQTMIIYEIACYEIDELNMPDFYEIKYGNTIAEVNAASWQRQPYGYYASVDAEGRTFGDYGYDVTSEYKIKPRYAQFRAYLNNNTF